MTESARERADRRYAQAETSLEGYYAKRRRRGPPVTLATVLVLTLAVGVVVAVDLRRLQTPRGTALTWTAAAVFGDCDSFERLSVASGTVDGRTAGQRCRELRSRTEAARQNSSGIGLDTRQVRQQGRQAVVQVELRRAGRTDTVDLALRRSGSGWVVLRSAATCAAVGGC